MIQYDTLQRFLFENTNVRGEMIRMRASYQAVSEHHPYAPTVKQLLGQALAATALLSSTIKFEGSLILQTQGDGPLKVLVAQCTHEHHVRGLAQTEDENLIVDNFAAAIGKGHLAITIIPKEGERYQGIVAITGNNLADTVETYFQQSEQLPTILLLASNEESVSGLLLQSMPDLQTQAKQNFWEHIVHLARTLSSQELLELPNEEILKRLFHEEDVRLFGSEPVSFRCDCNIERMERALLIVGHEEVKSILAEYKKVTVICEFCNYHYDFDAIDIENLFKVGSVGSSSTKH